MSVLLDKTIVLKQEDYVPTQKGAIAVRVMVATLVTAFLAALLIAVRYPLHYTVCFLATKATVESMSRCHAYITSDWLDLQRELVKPTVCGVGQTLFVQVSRISISFVTF